jgi:hypothetical protein
MPVRAADLQVRNGSLVASLDLTMSFWHTHIPRAQRRRATRFR